MALTATASPSTYDSIVESLHVDHTVTVSCSLNRPNIYFSISQLKSLKASKYVHVSKHLHSVVNNITVSVSVQARVVVNTILNELKK